MNSRSSVRSIVVVLVAVVPGLALGACGGGGDKTYKEGTPAATGQAPDCSVMALDVVQKMLKRPDLTGPSPGTRSDGVTCTFSAKGGGIAVNSVQLYNDVTEESFAVVRDGFKRNNNKVNKIKGWGDEAWASTVQSYSPTNHFAVRKGQVAVLITSTSDYQYMRDLMKEILKKL